MRFWEWLSNLQPGAATFIGSFTGSSLGLFAILVGASFNARLNRRRDDRMRIEERRAVAAGLIGELSMLRDVLLDYATNLRDSSAVKDIFTMRDLRSSSMVFPEMLSKVGLLDAETTRSVITAYSLIEQFGMKIASLTRGEKHMPLNPRLVTFEASAASDVMDAIIHTKEVVEKAITRLEAYKPYDN